MLLACTQVCSCCAQPTLRRVNKNTFTGGVEALGKLSRIEYLCVRGGFAWILLGIGTNRTFHRLIKTRRIHLVGFTNTGVWIWVLHTRICSCCAQPTRRYLERNKFSGGIEALGKLQQMRTLCVGEGGCVYIVRGHRNELNVLCASVN